MNINLIICSAGFGLIILFSTIYLLIKKKLRIKYALVWIILFTILLISILIPGFLDFITNLFGFQTASNMVISVFVVVLVAINITLTIVISKHSRQIIKLNQEIAILKKELHNK